MNNIDISAFFSSLENDDAPVGLTVQLEALWHDGKGDWDKAHDLIDQLSDKQSAHIHAYLHRKEGDLWNADYWYRRADQQRPNMTLEAEWEELVRLFLSY